MNLKNALVNRLNDLITKRHLTHYQLSLKSGVPESTISTILSGKTNTIKLSTLYDLCCALDCELKDFFDCIEFKMENLED